MQEVYRLIAQTAATNAHVVIEGETGTGKELVARAIHASSRRRKEPFVAVNCAALPQDLVESELFGSERGAFTGAVSRAGRFEQANGGTLFLDEIGDLPAAAQATLLRVVDQRVVQRLGSDRAVAVDVRLISATNVDLAAATTQGHFRTDLWYRIQQMTIRLPPLRDRGLDLVELLDALLPTLLAASGLLVNQLSDDARAALLAHDWPGNVRELEHALTHAIGHAHGAVIEVADLPKAVRHESVAVSAQPIPARPAHLSLARASAALKAAAERQWIESELQKHHTQVGAAEALGINVRTLYEKMLRHSLKPPERPR